ncbi:hypothetical protein OSB04_026464 [Centaurea solstitialis]|uniref:Uncharacterized protein n=1 Tax=Centaurea solstitialis TaxID=347529 RepID=A0AA38SJE8_9ASTR|nr:hypothetical protein OSB04_026464 [Centaurea solstitialis]
MPLNLLKLASSISVHHHRHKWLRRTITTGEYSAITQFAPQTYVISNNNNRLGFRGSNSKGFRYYSENRGGKVFASMESVSRDDMALPSHDRRQLKLLTLPTILTIARVAAVPLLVSTFYMNSWLGTTATTSIFVAAAITDWLDGYLARRMNLGTAFGAFLDPVADKLMVAATLVLLCTRPPEAAMFEQLPWLLTVPSIAIIGREGGSSTRMGDLLGSPHQVARNKAVSRWGKADNIVVEITMSAVREWAASQGSKLSEAVAVNNLGKWKTATQMSSLTILLVIRDSSFRDVGFVWAAAGVGLLYVSSGLAIWSLVVYMKKIWKVMVM